MDVVAIGDTTEDIFLGLHDASLQCDIDGANCKLCLDYADKIAVESKIIVPAVGNAANHAIGVSRLGVSSGIYTVVGKDDQGEKAKTILEQNHVDTSFLQFDAKHGTNLSIVINFRTERTILVYHEPREYQLPDISHTKWVYLTSASGDGVVALHQQTLDFLNNHPETKLAFNPGTHQIHLGKAELLPILQKTNLIFVNREEAAQVLEIETRDIKTLATGFHDIGIETVVITDGPEGAYASDGRHIYQLDIYPGPVVERTGAGDAFGSGMLAALVHGKTLTQAMQWGNANSTSVVQFVGAREGLLEQRAVEHMMSEHADITPKVFASYS
ncbi:MAG TPA: carbohydrate kinase family protein [Candidatus Andersenbacteria bacterium]|nr:carbohydrate kinase family protein [Candidatus Andersenbacteria bacterium]